MNADDRDRGRDQRMRSKRFGWRHHLVPIDGHRPIKVEEMDAREGPEG